MVARTDVGYEERPRAGVWADPSYQAFRILHFGIAMLATIAGIDKFTNLLTDWSKYLPEFMTKVVPVSPHTFMMGVGVIEIVAGLAVLTALPRLGAYVVALWLVLIAGSVTIAGFYDIAVRDLVMAVAAVTLARLTEVHEAAARAVPEPRSVPRPVGAERAA